MFKILLSKCISLTYEVSNILNLLFLCKMPLYSDLEARPLLENIWYMHLGNIDLCFYQKFSVCRCTVQNFTKLFKESPVHHHLAAEFLQLVRKSRRENLCTSSQLSPDCYDLCEIEQQEFVEGSYFSNSSWQHCYAYIPYHVSSFVPLRLYWIERWISTRSRCIETHDIVIFITLVTTLSVVKVSIFTTRSVH